MTCDPRIQDSLADEAARHMLLALEVAAERTGEGWTPAGTGRLTVRSHTKITAAAVVERRTYELTDALGRIELVNRVQALEALESHKRLVGARG